MKLASRWIAGLSLALAGIAPAHAATYSSLYVFGDSLVDAGNAFLATNAVEANPAKGYVGGRFSNGPTFADDLAVALHLTVPLPALAGKPGSTSFAVGGATAQTSADPRNFSFNKQTDFVTGGGYLSIPSDALVLVTFGGNDVRDTIGIGGDVNFTSATLDFRAGLDALYDLGARNFLIVGSPDIGDLPASKALADATRLDELSFRSQDITNLFANEAATLGTKADANVRFFNLYDYEQDLLADPTQYGLASDLNVTTPCWNPANPSAADCSNSLYFDPIHPTQQVHAAIANAIVADLATVPEPASWMMMIVGFGAVGVGLRRRGMPVAA